MLPHLHGKQRQKQSNYQRTDHGHCKNLKMVVASAAEAEVASLFHAAQTIVPIRVTADKLGH